MKHIMRLKSRGLLTDTQVLAAHKFARAPNAYPMAPSLYRVLHDAVIREEPLEAMEKRRGWPARSAKAIVGLLLHALQEMGATHGEVVTADELKEQVEHLTASDDTGTLVHLMKRFRFRRTEARLFLILQRAGGRILSYDQIMRRLYADRIDDPPNDSIIKVMVAKMRPKLIGSEWAIETVWGVGYYLKRSSSGDRASTPSVEGRDQRLLIWYAQHIHDKASIIDIARREGVAPSAVLRGIWKLVNEHDDEDGLDAMALKAMDARKAEVSAGEPEAESKEET